jgi:hypothetical protein
MTITVPHDLALIAFVGRRTDARCATIRPLNASVGCSQNPIGIGLFVCPVASVVKLQSTGPLSWFVLVVTVAVCLGCCQSQREFESCLELVLICRSSWEDQSFLLLVQHVLFVGIMHTVNSYSGFVDWTFTQTQLDPDLTLTLTSLRLF